MICFLRGGSQKFSQFQIFPFTTKGLSYFVTLTEKKESPKLYLSLMEGMQLTHAASISNIWMWKELQQEAS